MILQRLELGMFMSNCYIIGSEMKKEGIVIDPGDEPEVILDSIKKLGLNIKMILLTHAHMDHVAAVVKVKEVTGASLAMHSKEPIRKGIDVLMGIPFPKLPAPDRLLEEGNTVDVADLHFTVIHTPGHTPGGACFLGDGFVFTGDTLFAQSVGRSDLGGGNHEQLINSIKTKLMILPDECVVYPGHGPETTIGDERRHNPFLQVYSAF